MTDWVYCELEMPTEKTRVDVAEIAGDGKTVAVYRNVRFDGKDFVGEIGKMLNVFAWRPISAPPEFKRFGKRKYFINGKFE